ncbi:MAG: zinc-dependent peptidase [Planctomycetes bacterium]|nr:zinc-dependent peptidase [Planctomycetota bacterium]
MAEPLPEEWETVLKQNVPLYSLLPAEMQRELRGLINIFLHEKRFEGCGGLEITDEIRVTVAGQACILLLNRKTDFYPRLTSILVYPGAYVAKEVWHTSAGVAVEEDSVRLGESWDSGTVVLAWDSIKHGAWDWKDGHNIVMHEFAHRLDQQDGTADGAPILEQRSRYVTWARTLSREYEQLQKKVKRGRKTVMDDYGATDPAEFFAVATETFFEKSRQMKKKHPELYSELHSYYKLDPAAWPRKIEP